LRAPSSSPTAATQRAESDDDERAGISEHRGDVTVAGQKEDDMMDATTARSGRPGHGLILVLNCGSSSIKFAVFDPSATPLPRQALWNGKVLGIGGADPDFEETGVAPFPIKLDTAHPYRAALRIIRDRVSQRLDGRRIGAVAHRIVHGGSKYSMPVRLDANVLADLKGYIPLAPLHQPFALEAVEILLREQPELPQMACFDTAFHHTLPQVEQVLPLPYDAWQRGLRRYGFHGLSYEYMAVALPERHGDAACGRTVVAHLGSGASLCAMQGLKSVATTMGFSALDGLMMGTRTGALDPGAVLYLMEVEKLSLEQVGASSITSPACSAFRESRPSRASLSGTRTMQAKRGSERAWRWTSTCVASCARSVPWSLFWAAWTCSCSRRASVNTTPSFASASVRH